jgi:hypothetical protein
MTVVRFLPESIRRHNHAFFATQESATLTGSAPSTRGDSIPPAGKQPDPNGMTRGAPDSFYELVAR